MKLKKTGNRFAGILAAVLLLQGCSTGKTAADPNGSAVSSSQMMELNEALPVNQIDDNYRNTYEIFPYSFYDSNSDGIGDLKGVDEKLDYISDLGFNAIWLMPISPSPTYHKYDVTDYMEIDPEYGTLQDYEKLVKDAHAKDMHVINDLVLNHTSSSHPWFEEAVQYLKTLKAGEEPDVSVCPYFAYYNFTKEEANGYASLAGTDWYYEARFWEGMPDLNLDNEAVREEISKIMQFWIDEGVDGFRLDAVTSYYTADPDANTAFLAWLTKTGKEMKSDLYFVGEAWTNQSGYAPLYASGIDSLFDFAFAGNEGVIAGVVNGSYGADDFVSAMKKEEELYASYNPDFINAPFYTNHDMARSAGYYPGDTGEAKTKFAEGLNFLQTGNCYLYYGEELGMKGAGKDENKRAPMQWNTDQSAQGMTQGPQDMTYPEMKYGSLEAQSGKADSIYTYVREAMKIRNAYPSIARGKTVPLDDMNEEEIAGFIRDDGEHESVLILLNEAGEEETADVSSLSQYGNLSAVLLSGSEEVKVNDTSVTMPAYSIAVFTE